MNFKTYLGSGAAMTIGLGAVPTRLRIINLATGLAITDWQVGMLANSAVAGGVIFNNAAAMVITPQTIAQGVQRYFGGDLVATAGASVVVDPALNSTLNVNYAPVNELFSMDTAANGTGHISVALTTGAGAGSLIELAYVDAQGLFQSWTGRIVALSGSGLTADQVTLDSTAPNVSNARVVWVGPQYDLVQVPAGTVVPAGVKLLNTTYMTSAVMYGIQWE